MMKNRKVIHMTVREQFAEQFKVSVGKIETLIELTDAAEKAQIRCHNESDSDGELGKIADEAILKVEVFATQVMGVDEIKWPGLFPVFIKDGREFYVPE